MDEQAFQNKLSELMAKINELPAGDRARLEQIAQDTRERRERIKTSVSELQESLDYLRLSVKYLVFDLEATRRENAYLRKLVEQSARENSRRRDKRNKPNDNFLEGEPNGGN